MRQRIKSHVAAQKNRLIVYGSRIEKRLRVVIATVVMSSLLFLATFFFFDKWWVFLPVLVASAYMFTFFSILEGVEQTEWFTLFVMPVGLSVVSYMFYYLIPVRWLTRVPFIAIYAISVYAILLTSNIFNVGVEKSIRLYKAAFSVNYFYHTFIAFIAYTIIFSLRANALVNAILSGLLIVPLAYQLLWTIKLNIKLERENIVYTGFIAILIAEFALIISFIPFKSSISALVMTAAYYTLAGLTTAHIDGRLFKNTIREYVLVSVFVAIIAILTLAGW